MIDPREPIDFANEIRLERLQYPGAFWIVEGRDDELFCKKFTQSELCKTIVGRGKFNVCAIIQILDEGHFDGALGLVDADFDIIEGRKLESANLLSTDLHDLECMLIRFSLRKILREYGNEEKIEEFGKDVEETVLLAARPIGCLRLYSERENLNLRFHGLNYGRFINRKSLKISRKKLIQEVKNRSQRQDLANDALLDGITAIESQAYDLWQICSGTDLLGILSFGLRTALGTNDAADVRENNLRRMFRVAYQNDNFSKTELYRQIRVWESDNAPFRILSE